MTSGARATTSRCCSQKRRRAVTGSSASVRWSMGSCINAAPPDSRDTADCLITTLARCSRPSGGNGRGSRGDGDCVSNRSYLKLFVDCLEKYQKLNDTEFGRLVRAALCYKATGAEPDELGREALVWDGMRLDIDRDNESYTATCSARAEAGRKGAEARWQNHSKNSKNGKSFIIATVIIN